MTRADDEFATEELIGLAVPYALHALSDDERDDIETRLAEAGLRVANPFFDEVRAARETAATMSAATAEEPPAELRHRLLAAVADDRRWALAQAANESPSSRWRSTVLAAAAVLAVGLGTLGVGIALRPAPLQQPSKSQQVFAAHDVRTISGAIPVGGTATVVFSHDENAGVLVMNNVPPPKPGTVYQMWLISDAGATSAGTMDAEAVSPSTTAVLPNLGKSTALAFTVEPNNGSQKPTGQFIAELPIR